MAMQVHIGLPGSEHINSWSAQCFPLLLLISVLRCDVRHACAETVGTLRSFTVGAGCTILSTPHRPWPTRSGQ
eukprot:1409767-Rhodomonas_salina.2